MAVGQVAECVMAALFGWLQQALYCSCCCNGSIASITANGESKWVLMNLETLCVYNTKTVRRKGKSKERPNLVSAKKQIQDLHNLS